MNIPNWGYNQVMTLAQVELLACDIPVTFYKHDRKGGKPDKKKMDDLKRRWQEKHGKPSVSGKAFSLNDFIRTGRIPGCENPSAS